MCVCGPQPSEPFITPPPPLNKNRPFLDFRKSLVTKQTGRSCTPAVTIPSAIVAEAAAEIQNRHTPASPGDQVRYFGAVPRSSGGFRTLERNS